MVNASICNILNLWLDAHHQSTVSHPGGSHGASMELLHQLSSGGIFSPGPDLSLHEPPGTVSVSLVCSESRELIIMSQVLGLHFLALPV